MTQTNVLEQQQQLPGSWRHTAVVDAVRKLLRLHDHSEPSLL